MTDVFPPDTVRCDACPVLCYIKRGHSGACDRYANLDGQLVRVDPHMLLDRAKSQGMPLVPFLEREGDWDGKIVKGQETFVTAIGAGTTYPDYKPAPFIVSCEVEGVDMVTVVTEGIFSYCGVKLKIDTDRHLGPERNFVRAQGETGRPRDHRRVRLANAFAWRGAPSHRRHKKRRPHHLRDAA